MTLYIIKFKLNLTYKVEIIQYIFINCNFISMINFITHYINFFYKLKLYLIIIIILKI